MTLGLTKPERTMIWQLWPVSGMRRSSSRPSSLGRTMSVSRMSGRSSPTMARASAPSAAVPTTSRSLSALKSSFISLQKSVFASAMSIRILVSIISSSQICDVWSNPVLIRVDTPLSCNKCTIATSIRQQNSVEFRGLLVDIICENKTQCKPFRHIFAKKFT